LNVPCTIKVGLLMPYTSLSLLIEQLFTSISHYNLKLQTSDFRLQIVTNLRDYNNTNLQEVSGGLT